MSKKKRPFFVTVDKNGKEKIVPSLLASYTRERLPFKLVRNSGKNDLQLYVYENGVYKFCAPETMKGIVKSYVAEYDERLISMATVNEVFYQLTTDLEYTRIDDLNGDESIINFENGILKIDAANTVLLSHSPEYLSTVQIPCEWKDEPIETPVFDHYLDDLCSGQEDVKQLLLEFIGVIISNVKGYRMKKALFLFGKGDTGKSQLKSLCERLIGSDNYSSADFNELEERFGTSALYGKRLAGSSDASYMSVKELKTFKKLTGGDSINAEFKGQKSFDFVFGGLLWLCMNCLPKFGGDNGEWVYRRIMPVECKNEIPAEKQDKQLLDKMYGERAGIVQKAVRALQRVIANGYRFDESDGVIRRREQYMRENNSVKCFWEECVTRREIGKPFDSCSVGRMYHVYRAWCRDNTNGFCKTEHEFRSEVCDMLGGSFEALTTVIHGFRCFTDYTVSPDYLEACGYDIVY